MGRRSVADTKWSKVGEMARRWPAWLWFTVPLTAALATAASVGLFWPNMYAKNTPLMAAQLTGGDIVSLCVLVPLVVISAVLASRGSARATVLWLGSVAFLVYFYLVFAFHVAYNGAFLLYVTILGCAVYALILAVPRALAGPVSACTVRPRVATVASVALAVVPALFYAMSLGAIVPAALAGDVPQAVTDFGAPTYFGHVIDMALALPAYAIASVQLWRRTRVGFVLGGMMLTLVAVMMIALLSMFAVQSHRDIAVAPGDVAIIGTVAAVYVTLLILYVRDLAPRSPDATG